MKVKPSLIAEVWMALSFHGANYFTTRSGGVLLEGFKQLNLYTAENKNNAQIKVQISTNSLICITDIHFIIIWTITPVNILFYNIDENIYCQFNWITWMKLYKVTYIYYML